MATVNCVRYSGQSGGGMARVADYLEQEKKTLDEYGQRLISGQNCSAQFAAREFTATREMHHKKSPVWFYHYTQSFHPDENITGQLAHEIAKEFAAKAWPESEVLIATHIDADHIHSHFLVNAVCYETGKMLRQGPNTLQHLRKLSDELCMVHGLSILPPNQEMRHGMSAREYRSAAKGQSWKFQLINAVDDCMRRSRTKEEFIRNMKQRGYQVRWDTSRKHITYTHPNGKKARDIKLHDTRYLKEVMEREFRIRAEIIHGRIETAQRTAERSHTATGTDTPAASTAAAFAAHPDPVRDVRNPDTTGEAASPLGRTVGVADGVSVQAFRDTQFVSHQGADSTAPKIVDPDRNDTGTGWEAEREAVFSAQHQITQTASAAPVSGHAVDPHALGSLVGSVVQFGRSLERDPYTEPVIDSTTMHQHIDKKELRKIKEKKIALGQKADDHEEEQTWQQTM